MFVSDGYVCASQPTATLRVTDARDVGNLCMLVTFNTGETRLLDATELTGFEAFAPLGNQKTFSSSPSIMGYCNGSMGRSISPPRGSTSAHSSILPR